MAVKVIIHCSDSDFGNASLIENWHLERGWSGIGYHFVILNGWTGSNCYNAQFKGHLETGRPVNGDDIITKSERGAHAYGFNHNSIGICLIGKSGSFCEEQLNTLLELVFNLNEQFGGVEVLQHSDVDPKKPYCAGLNMEQFRKNLKRLVKS